MSLTTVKRVRDSGSFDCPKCGNARVGVIDSRFYEVGYGPRRRRACADCGYRWSTVEVQIDWPDKLTNASRLAKRLMTLTSKERKAFAALLDLFDGEVTP